MTHSRSYTSATPNASPATVTFAADPLREQQKASTDRYLWRIAWFTIFLLGVALRLLRLSWQPLWWDEGYSIYFATEPLSTMLWLTAHDIHPPLYYALLHAWFSLTGSTGPEVSRLLSVLVGIVTLPVMSWAANSFLPARRWLALLAMLLLAISPIHIFYSQEVRMYGLALLLTLVASTFLWRMQQGLTRGEKAYAPAVGYVISAALALLTLYYSAFLLLAHQLWALCVHRKDWRRLRWFLVTGLLVVLIQLPWWNYALPKLMVYVADKVIADADRSLPLWSYVWRHWLAFFGGHVTAAWEWLELLRRGAAALVVIPLVLGLSGVVERHQRPHPNPPQVGEGTVVGRPQHLLSWLLALTLIPLLLGFTVNLYFPFFPEGGERLLLQILPYVLLLLVFSLGNLFAQRPRLAIATLLIPLLAAAIGIVVYFTTPRYVEHDYRPLIDNVVKNSRTQDTVIAIFPWQVGYWRAYSPRLEDGTLLPPQPAAVTQEILLWDDSFASKLDSALQKGTIWLPMPLSFGSTLPVEIEEYLESHARNLENHWYSSATRLSAWVRSAVVPQQHPIGATFGPAASGEAGELALTSGGVAPPTAASANVPLAVDLCWQPAGERIALRATLRFVDEDGYTWAQRDLTPLAAYTKSNPADPCLEAIAFNVPAGLPPANYQLFLGVGPAEGDMLLTPNYPSGSGTSPFVPLGHLAVTTPVEPVPPQRLPIEHDLRTAVDDEGLLLLGYSGPDAGATVLAGDAIALALFLQNSSDDPPQRDVYVSLLDRSGNGVAGWEGWPFPDYPTSAWTQGALAQVPVEFYLPPDLVAGKFTLVAGFLDVATGEKSAPATLTKVQVIRRQASFTAPTTEASVTPPVQFGTHARLVGYTVTRDGSTLHLALLWEIVETLLPPHHIFVHLFDAGGQRIAQSDSEPITATGRAPTSSWLPGEYLLSEHTIVLPPDAQEPFTIQTGLYLPATGERLPAFAESAPVGNSATISPTLTP